MCERSSCHIINAATNYICTETLTDVAKTTTSAYKCQAGFSINRRQQQQQQNQYDCNQQFHHSSSSYHHQQNKTTNVKMLQHEQHQQISNDSNLMHDLSFPMHYKQTNNNSTNNLVKTKSLSNHSVSSAPQQQQQLHHHYNHHQQQMQLPHQQQQHTNYTHGTTMSSINSTSSSPSPPPPPAPLPPNSAVGGGGCYGSTGGAAPTTIGVNLRVTGQCSQGGRKYMEDYFSVAYQQSENAKDLEYAFIGIYDGHGGAEAATFAKEHLMMQIINQKAFWSDSDHDVLRAIREGYIATHYAMWRDQENWPKTANGLLSTAGTTATIAFIRREKIYIGHVGDSGIVLGYQNEGEKFWRAKQLTVDHKPESVEERARIQRSGGKVLVKSGVPRVVWNRPRNAGHRGPIRCNTLVDEVPFLAVARSLGDLWSYNSMRNVFVVSPDPDVQVIKINPKTFKCLIFGTDGLWNVVTPQEAVDTVYERECINERLQAYANAEGANIEWTNPSKGLVERALKTWSAKKMRADNTSVVTVILYPPGGDTTVSANPASTNMHSYNESLPYASCGYEYTEMCADLHAAANDCYGISYEEIAEKHQMPEAFRDFDYYLDEELVNASLQAQQRLDENCVETNKYCNGDLTYWNNWSWEERQSECAAGDYNHHTSTSSDVSICSKAISHNGGGSGGAAGVANNCVSIMPNVSDENAVDGAPASLSFTNYHNNHSATNTASNSNASSDVSNELGGGANASFMTFAESYNSFLNDQMSHDSTTSSNSNSNCQIISGTNEILQEQQLYQQQCMSEEEGYSLTKLETRREQQRCSGGVQTFKIFQTHDTSGASYVPQRTPQHNQHKQRDAAHQAQRQNECLQNHASATPQLTLQEARELEEALTWEPGCAAPLGTLNRFVDYAAEPQQSLELSSLLQQEREEEQQVAYERRLQMQRQLAHAKATAAEEATKDERNSSSKLVANIEQQQQTVLETTVANERAEEALLEEYIEEEEAERVDEVQTVTIKAPQTDKDKSVQINEISSSNDEQNELECCKPSTSNARSSPQIIEKIEKIEILQAPKVQAPKLTRLGRHPLMLHKSPPLSHYRKSKASSALSCASSSGTISTTTTITKDKPKVATFEYTSRPPKACPGRTTLKRSQIQFPNIPNENARCSETTQSSHEMSKRRRYDGYSEYVLGAVSSTSSNNHHQHHNSSSRTTNVNANNGASSSRSATNNNYRNRRCNSATAMAHASNSSANCAASVLEKRQLRSNSGNVDYSKRTLRTRNSLTKDLKAKASLTTTMRRVTTQFLHETAVSLMQSSSALAQQRAQRNSDAQQKNRLTINRNSNNACNSASSSGIASRRARAEKLLAAANADNLEAAFSHVINLRSRKVAHLAVAAAAVAAAATANHAQSTTSRRTKGSLGAGCGSPLVSSSTALMRRERHNLRSLSTRNAASASMMCGASNQRGGEYGNYSKATRSGSTICAYNLPSASASAPNNKMLSRAAGVTAAVRPRAHALLMTKQAVGSGDGVNGSCGIMRGGGSITAALTQTPTSYGKRTTALRSGNGGSVGGAATTMMLTRSSGRNGKRLSR